MSNVCGHCRGRHRSTPVSDHITRSLLHCDGRGLTGDRCGTRDIYSASGTAKGVGEYPDTGDMRVCEHITTQDPIFTDFCTCYSLVVARCSSNGFAIRYVLPVCG